MIGNIVVRYAALALLMGSMLVGFLFDSGLGRGVTVKELILFAATVAMLLMRHKPLPKLFYGVSLYFVVYALWTFAATLIWQRDITWNEMARFAMIPMTVTVLLWAMMRNIQQSMKILCFVSIAYVTAIVAMGIIEHFFDWHLATAAAYGNDELRGCPCGVCYNPNDNAVMLLLATFYAVAWLINHCTRQWQWLSLALLLIAVPIVWWSGCRLGLVAWGGYVVFLFRQIFIRYRKAMLTAMGGVPVAAVVGYFCLADNSIRVRGGVYLCSLLSVMESWGLGFGINGDISFYKMLDNHQLVGDVVNAHSYLLQILITSGLPLFFAYCGIIVWTMRTMARTQGRNEFWLMPLLYLFLLFAPSSALYLWGQYLYFCGFVCAAANGIYPSMPNAVPHVAVIEKQSVGAN